MKMTWLDAVILAIAKQGGSCHLNRVCDDAPRIYGARPATLSYLVSDTIQKHSSDSKTFKSSEPDVFYSVNGIGSGIWGLRGLPKTLDELISPGGIRALVDAMLDDDTLATGARGLRNADVVGFAQHVMPRAGVLANGRIIPIHDI